MNYLYKQIIKYLEELIEENKLIIRYRIPSERQLALKFGVSRITAKNAINFLVEEGKLYRRQGKGTFIVNPDFKSSDNQFFDSRTAVGLLLPNFDSKFITDIVKGVSNFLSKIGIPLLIMYSGENLLSENFLVSRAKNINISGLIAYSIDHNLYNKLLLKLALDDYPIVFLDRYPAINNIDVVSISGNPLQSGFDATTYLYNKGHRNIGFIKDRDHETSSVAQRLKGYEIALSKKGLPFDSRLMTTIDREVNIANQIGEFLTSIPEMTAVIVSCSEIIFFFEALEKYNIQVPKKLSVIIYGNEWATYERYLPFKPHYMNSNSVITGENAAKILVDMMKNREISPRINTVDFTLIEGNSVADITLDEVN